MLSLVSMTLLLTTPGCTVVIRPEKPPIYMAPETRPALVDEQMNFTKAGQAWLQKLVNAYMRNCITLKVLRSEDPQECEKGIR